MLRLDRIVRQPQGHIRLLGGSEAGKTAETGVQVEEIQKSLADQSLEIKIKNKEVEQPMQQDIESSQLLDKETKEITTKKSEVMKDLEQVEPTVMNASCS